MNSDLPVPFRLFLVLLLVFQFRARAQDVSSVSLYRTALYEQVGNAAPQPIPETPEESPFLALSVMEMSGDFLSDLDNLLFVRAVTLQPPTGSLRALEFYEEFSGFVYVQTFTSGSAQENAFRAGNYVFTYGSLISGDSDYGLTVDQTALPSPAQVVDFDGAQSIDASQPFRLQWTPDAPPVGGGRLYVYDKSDGSLVFDSQPVPGAVGSIEIPAGTLQPDHAYRAEIDFTQFNNLDGSAASMTTTRVPLATSSGNLPAPAIASLTVNAASELVFVVNCTPGIPLNLKQTLTLGGNWESLQTVTPDVSPATLTVLPAQIGGDVAFFQATQ